MRAIVDEDACVGCGLCPQVCPDVFEMGDDDIARVKTDPVPAEKEADARDAAGQCPVEAITIEE